MKPFGFEELLAAVGGRPSGTLSGELTGITIDSRRVRPGELFFAITGERFNGHHYVDDAVRLGARAAVISDERFVPKQAPAVIVPDTRQALLDLAGHYRAQLPARVAAVTGSNGKTTVRAMLAALLRPSLRVVEAEANFNNDIGVPLTVFRMEPDTEVGLFELEMNEIGGTRRLAEACQPLVGVVTNVGDSHLELMRDRAGVAREKAELIEALPAGGTAVLNADDPLVAEMGSGNARCRRVSFGLNPGADVFAAGLEDRGIDGFDFLLQGELPVRLSVPGRHNVGNCLAACAAAHALGLPFAAMPAALERFELPPGRLRVHRLNEGITLIDDSYNANPQSMAAAIELLCHCAPEGQRVAFLGDMLELGGISMEAHTEVGTCAVGCLDRVAFVGRLSQHTLAVAVRQGLAARRVRLYPDNNSAAEAVFDIVKPGDTILVKGSRAIGMELIVKVLLEHYGK